VGNLLSFETSDPDWKRIRKRDLLAIELRLAKHQEDSLLQLSHREQTFLVLLHLSNRIVLWRKVQKVRVFFANLGIIQAVLCTVALNWISVFSLRTYASTSATYMFIHHGKMNRGMQHAYMPPNSVRTTSWHKNCKYGDDMKL
jgi:hypothetical protein